MLQDELFDCQERTGSLRIFHIVNSSNRRLVVLAKSSSCALHFALADGHIRDRQNGQVQAFKSEYEEYLRNNGSALGRALRDGFPGVVEFVGQNVVMKSSRRVFTPMTVVSSD